jgi:hypothetical protein
MDTRVEVGSNTSTVTLRVVGGHKNGSLKSDRQSQCDLDLVSNSYNISEPSQSQ